MPESAISISCSTQATYDMRSFNTACRFVRISDTVFADTNILYINDLLTIAECKKNRCLLQFSRAVARRESAIPLGMDPGVRAERSETDGAKLS